MADQLYADAIQQLDVVLLGSPAAEVMDILAASLSKPATMTSAQPCPYTFTATPPVPPLASVLLEGITESSSAPATVTVGSSKLAEEIPVTLEASKTEISDTPVLVFKCQQDTTALESPSTLAQPSTTSAQSPSTGPATTIATVVMPEVATPTDVYPEHINRPSRGENYLCQICHFSHTNLDSVLTHIR